MAGRTPAELMFGRNLRTRLDLIFPDTSLQVSRTQNLQRRYHDAHTKACIFEPGDCVYYRDFSGPKPSWKKGEIINRRGPYSYQLQRADGSLIQRHVDHLLSLFTQEDNLESQVEDVDMGVPQTREEPAPVASELRRSTQERRPPNRYTPERF